VATYLQVGNAMEDLVARKRIRSAILFVGYYYLTLELGPDPTPEEEEEHAQQQALSTSWLRESHTWTDKVTPRVIANPVMDPYTVQLTDDSLSTLDEANLDDLLYDIVEIVFDEYLGTV
jgi:hypothetical protein